MSRALFSKKEVQAATDSFVKDMDGFLDSEGKSSRTEEPETWAFLDKAMRKALVAAIDYESNQLKKVNQ